MTTMSHQVTARAKASLQVQTHRRRQIRAKSPGQPRITPNTVTPAPALESPYEYYVGQRKEELDTGAPLWRRLFFAYVYRPFLRFCYFKLKIPTFSGADTDGTMFWLEHQTICHSRVEAVRLANKPGWYFHRLPVGESLPDATCACQDHTFPAEAQVVDLYEQARNPTVRVEQSRLAKLESQIAQSDDLIARFKVASSL